MVEYALNIKVAPSQVEPLKDHEWQFCFAMRCQSDEPNTNMDVISHTAEPDSNIQIKWKEEYWMAGSKLGFWSGALVNPSTGDPLQIKFGQSFVLKDWKDVRVQHDPGARYNGFLFDTAPSAAATLYQTVQSEPRAVYTTPGPRLPPNSTDSLIPLPAVGVWFQRDVEIGSMVIPRLPLVIPMTETTMDVEYNDKGQWQVTTGEVDH